MENTDFIYMTNGKRCPKIHNSEECIAQALKDGFRKATDEEVDEAKVNFVTNTAGGDSALDRTVITDPLSGISFEVALWGGQKAYLESKKGKKPITEKNSEVEKEVVKENLTTEKTSKKTKK